MFKRVDVLAIAILIALIYLGAIIFFQFYHNLSGLAETQHLNILGDSIGGIVAPLSLIFLVAAVIIQRQELILTKAELAESAKALNNQVIEQRQHREFVGQQTELMRKEAEASAENTRKAYKLSLFDRRYAIYSELNQLRQNLQSGSPNWTSIAELLSDFQNRSRFLFGEDVNHWFTWLREEVRLARETALKREQMDTGYWNNGGNWVPNTSEEVELVNEQLESAHRFILITLSHDVLYKVFAESMEVTD